MTQYSFHSRILDKLRSRIDSGAVCLIAQRNFTGEVSPAGNLYFGNILGTVEFSASDFIHTPFENVGHERKLYVADLAVRQDARRRGIASKLLKIIEDYAVKYSYGSIYLHVEVNNSEALKLYTRNGYTLVPQDENVTLFTENRLQKSADLYHFLMKNVSATLNDDDESQILDFKL
jgi:ribosomal protein S18 acetylase RimI-like enzyme